MTVKDQRLVWLDMEMTGLDPEKERIIEVAVVVTEADLTLVAEGPVLVIHQSDELLDAMDNWNKGTHGRSGLIDKVKASTLTEAEAEDIYWISSSNMYRLVSLHYVVIRLARTVALCTGICRVLNSSFITAT